MRDVDDMQPPTAEVGHGAAQSPRTLPWKPAHGGPRTLDEAIQIARRSGISISEDVRFVVADDLVPPDAYALWCVVQAHGSMRWKDFYAKERIPMKIRQSVLESIRLIRTGIGGNLHDQAWDHADRLVAILRAEAR